VNPRKKKKVKSEHKKPGFGATPRENDKFKNYHTNKNLIDACPLKKKEFDRCM